MFWIDFDEAAFAAREVILPARRLLISPT